MANRAFIIPRRLDLSGVGLQVVDLVPNTSQKNSVYDGDGQSGYLKFACDRPGATVVSGNSYVSGSLTSTPVNALAVDDTTGNGNDCSRTGAAQFGLSAYLRERVNADPGGANDPLTPAEALAAAVALMLRAYNGQSLTLADINAALVATGAGANTQLVGGTNGSISFGTVVEVLRLLSGEAYVVKAKTIVADQNTVFIDLAARAALVANSVPAQGTFFAQGAFVARGSAGFRDIKPLALTSAVRSSAHEGRLSHLNGAHTLKVLNPNFAYTAAAVKAWAPRATTISGANIAATGVDKVCVVYDQAGNVLS